MRVIAGKAKGRKLTAPAGRAVRPTADKVRGAIFNVLQHRVALEGARILDLFAGSGALGIEALSRGASEVVFLENAPAAIRALRTNLQRCGFERQAKILRRSVQDGIGQLEAAGERFDGVLADPPYGRGYVSWVLATLATSPLLRTGGWVVLEHHVEETPAQEFSPLRLIQQKRYGKTALAFFTKEMATTPSTHSILKAVYAGSFDPITNGHIDIVRRAVEIFDQVIIAVAGVTTDAKKGGALFTAAERVEMIREALADLGERVVVDSFGGLLVDYCDQVGARVIIRGLRAVSDFEYEFQMAMMNRHLKPHIHTLFLPTSEAHSYTSSRLVKEVASLGGDISGQVPDVVRRRLLDKLRPSR
ncbi:MAG: hypothetical protein KatS3mg077_0541 [Candidatus Binatia bacterium]|nr:MAG: hypothetical protein KatS3mg077_0541 [Candidatus Binatia bacterium]